MAALAPQVRRRGSRAKRDAHRRRPDARPNMKAGLGLVVGARVGWPVLIAWCPAVSVGSIGGDAACCMRQLSVAPGRRDNERCAVAQAPTVILETAREVSSATAQKTGVSTYLPNNGSSELTISPIDAW